MEMTPEQTAKLIMRFTNRDRVGYTFEDSFYDDGKRACPEHSFYVHVSGSISATGYGKTIAEAAADTLKEFANMS